MTAAASSRPALVATALALVVALAAVLLDGPAHPGDPARALDVALVNDQNAAPPDDGDGGGDGDGGEGQGDQQGDAAAGGGEGQDNGQRPDGQGGQDGGGDKDDGGQADGQGEEFPGRDQIGQAGDDQYVSIGDVEPNSGQGEGGDFTGGSYSIQCSLSPHTNSDNPVLAPGERNGAQHVHEYAGNVTTNANSDQESLREGGTTCSNGDQSPIFWPVLRDLNQTGPDVGQDGGSLDGNVGAYVPPSTIDITFHGHGSAPVEPMPLNMVLVTGAAKAATEDGEGANAKYTCSGAPDRVTDQYPICPQDQQLQRLYDFPSCWNGQDTDSEDSISHIAFPGEDGQCADDEVPVPAARVTLSYNQPPGRSFAIDAFPEQQHDPITDHAFIENLTSENRAQAGADCINSNRRCVQGAAESASRSTDPRDRVATSAGGFSQAMANMMRTGFSPRVSGPPRPGTPATARDQSPAMPPRPGPVRGTALGIAPITAVLDRPIVAAG